VSSALLRGRRMGEDRPLSVVSVDPAVWRRPALRREMATGAPLVLAVGRPHVRAATVAARTRADRACRSQLSWSAARDPRGFAPRWGRLRARFHRHLAAAIIVVGVARDFGVTPRGRSFLPSRSTVTTGAARPAGAPPARALRAERRPDGLATRACEPGAGGVPGSQEAAPAAAAMRLLGRVRRPGAPAMTTSGSRSANRLAACYGHRSAIAYAQRQLRSLCPPVLAALMSTLFVDISQAVNR